MYSGSTENGSPLKISIGLMPAVIFDTFLFLVFSIFSFDINKRANTVILCLLMHSLFYRVEFPEKIFPVISAGN